MTLFQKYIQAALNEAKYSFDEETQSYLAVVEELPLCWGQGDTHEEARQELANVIEGWVLLSIRQGDEIPSIKNISLNIPHFKKKMEYAQTKASY